MQRVLSPKKICTWIALASFVFLILNLIASAAVLGAVMYLFPDFYSSSWGFWLLNNIPIYLVGFPAYLFILSTIPNSAAAPRETSPFNIGKWLVVLVFCLGAAYLLNMFSMGIIKLIDTLLSRNTSNLLDSLISNSTPLPAIIFGCMVPAVGEEFAFRFMIRKKMEGSGDLNYIIFSSFCFSLLHGNIIQIPYAFVLGMAFAWVYLQTGKLWLSMALHFMVNLMGMVVVPMLVAPRIEGNEAASAAVGIVMILLMLLSILIFVLALQKIKAGLRPPSISGWPYKAPRSYYPAQYYAPSVQNQYAYQNSNTNNVAWSNYVPPSYTHMAPTQPVYPAQPYNYPYTPYNHSPAYTQSYGNAQNFAPQWNNMGAPSLNYGYIGSIQEKPRIFSTLFANVGIALYILGSLGISVLSLFSS